MSLHRKKVSRFPETRWSLVGRAAMSDELTRQQALRELLLAYLPGLRAYLVEGRRVPEDVVDDLLHDFVVDKFLAEKLVHHAEQGKGKFRSFILKSLNNFVTTKLGQEYKAHITADGMNLDGFASDGDLRDQFDREWVKQVVGDTLELMAADCRARGRTDLWEVFCLRVVDPMLNGTDPADYERIVDRLCLETPRQAINLLANAKRCFIKHLRAAVSCYVHDEMQIDEEIADLRRIIEQ